MTALQALIAADGSDRIRFHGDVEYPKTPLLFASP